MVDYFLNIILLLTLHYLIGSVPTAYIILKIRYNKDITREGSGNVGTLNSYEITGSKSTGILVLIIDLLKGFIPAFLMAYILKFPFNVIVFPLIMVVFGHNYSIWLKFKGGRGLATAAGIALALNVSMLIIWCVIYYLVYKIGRNIHLGNVIATVLMPVIALIFGGYFMQLSYGYTSVDEFSGVFFGFWSIVSLIILSKHIIPFVEFIREKSITINNNAKKPDS